MLLPLANVTYRECPKIYNNAHTPEWRKMIMLWIIISLKSPYELAGELTGSTPIGP